MASQEVARLQEAIDGLLATRRHLRILEAGCGSRTHIRIPEDAYVVGIDISEQQLDLNAGLDEKIHGDIQTHDLPGDSFDLVVCWEVLEHVSDVEAVLHNFVSSLKAGGLVVLALPNVWSIKGMATKLTPYWFHAWFYRCVLHIRDLTPFPTYLRLSTSPKSVRQFAERHGLSVDYFSISEAGWQKRLRERYHLVGWRWRALRCLVKTGTLGRVDADLTDYLMILRKPSIVR
jgi:SAM-dependent methyltransferase